MRVLSIRNPDLSNQERSFLTAAYTSGTTLSIINNFAYAANDFTVVEEPGTEKAEVKQISALSGNAALTIATALKFNHAKDTPIIKTPWDQVEISYNISGGAWTVLSTSGLQFDKSHTIYVHSDGGATYNYRWRFKNSSSGTYSEYSPTYSGSGFNSNQAGFIVRKVRKISRTEGKEDVVTDKELFEQMNTAHDIIRGVRTDWWFLKFVNDTNMTTTDGTFRYNLDLLGGGTAGNPGFNLEQIDRIRYRYDDGSTDTTYPLKYRSKAEFDMLITDNDRQDDDWVNIYSLDPPDSSSDNGYLLVYPTPATTGRGTFYIDGYKQFTSIDDDIDTTPIPIPSVIQDFLLAYIERIRGNDTKAEYYEALFYGPADKLEDTRRITGIKLLEQLQKKQVPAGQPKQLIRFRGQKSISHYFGNRTVHNDRDYIAENFFDASDN